ncbi:hypothetical protein ACLK13_13605 [Escherichia coli]
MRKAYRPSATVVTCRPEEEAANKQKEGKKRVEFPGPFVDVPQGPSSPFSTSERQQITLRSWHGEYVCPDSGDCHTGDGHFMVRG